MNTKFIFGEAFAGLRRNITMTVAMIITTAISLALLASGLLVTDMTNRTKDMYLDRVEMMVELDEFISAEDATCSTDACTDVTSALESADGIESITYRNRDQNYARFVELFEDTDPALVSNTTAESLPAVILVRLEDPTDPSPLDAIRDLPQVTYVADQADDISEAVNNLDSVRNATFVIAAIQAIAAIFLIANMVQIAAYSRRREVDIMLMVGASRGFTQAPFVLEAVIASFIGGVLGIAGLFLGKSLVLDGALQGIYDAQLIAPVDNTHLWTVAPIVLVVGMIFSAVTAQITLRMYTRK